MANRLYDRLRKSIFKRLRKPAVRTVDGIRLTLNPAHALDRSLYIGHVAEQPQIDRMLRIVDDWRPQVFLDIGANIGLYALRLAAAGVAEIHAFEPVKATFDQLSQNIALNDWEDRIAAHHCAAGAEELQMTIDIDPATPDVSTLARAAHMDRWNFTEQETVIVKPLDALFDWAGRRILLKIDVEGFEVDVIAGAVRLLDENDCCLQIEAFPQNRDATIARMAELGYDAVDLIGNDYLFERRRPA